ncbi:hypothetical protein TWF970_009141 [Orbilia oligospora]|uniref:Uncharacterized protein n=1 Tax=Orbilia oligospora TaxID=2813651 RepID=A0A7C8V8X5_ORBOL|nr:hypothetical protein TWF970_009141 [Orbilia oligospora]
MSTSKIEIPPSKFLRGNHTGLGYCACSRCGREGQIICQSVRINHIEEKRLELEKIKLSLPQYIGLPVTPGEKKLEYEKIREYVLTETGKTFPVQTEDENLDPVKQTSQELMNPQAIAVANTFMNVYYPDHRDNTLEAKDIHGPEGKLLEYAFEHRVRLKYLEIVSLWKRIEKFHGDHQHGSTRGTISIPRNKVVDSRETLPETGTPATRRWKRLNYLNLDEEPNFFPGVVTDIGRIIWLTRQAMEYDGELLGRYNRRELDSMALELFMKFYLSELGGKADFMDFMSVSNMTAPDSRSAYSTFLVREWNAQIHQDLKDITIARFTGE